MARLPLFVPEDNWLYKFARLVCSGGLGQIYRYRVEGTDNLPLFGPALLAVNHQSDIDPVFVGMAFPRPLRYMAKIELFHHPALRAIITTLGAFPIDRGAGDRQALQTSLEVLAQGEALLMFPEGTRHHDGRVHPFLPGVGMIALRSGAPVIPAVLKGTSDMVQGGRLRLVRTALRAGPPVDLSGLSGRRSEMYTRAAERIHAAVASLYESFEI